MLRLSVILTSIALLLPTQAQARPKKNKSTPTACNISYLPFSPGMKWKYQYAIPPGVDETPNLLKSKVPETFEIEVLSVDSKAGKTTISLAETYRDVKRETTLSCNKEGLSVPVDSFFFAGELPGAIGMTVENASMKGEMYPGSKGLKKGAVLFVEVKTEVVQANAAEHNKAMLEIERELTVGKKEDVEVEHGIHSATMVQVALSGRAKLDASPTHEIPLTDGKAMLWFAPKLGLVRAYNRLSQGWELVSVTDAQGTAL